MADRKDAKGAAEKAEAKLTEEMREVMPLAYPPETDLPFHEREPDKVVPEEGTDGADTPSGAALRAVGTPDFSDAGSDEERVKGLRYRLEKYKKRWLG